MKMVNYYQEFNLDISTSGDDICKELRNQKRKWITRQNAADLEKRQLAEQKVHLIDEAILVFSDKYKKEEYDRKLGTEKVPQQQQQQYQQSPVRSTDNTITNEQIASEIISIYNTGDSEFVIKRCNAYIGMGYHLPDLYYYLGHAYWETNQISKAITALQKGIDVSTTGNKAPFYGDIANIYLVTLKKPEEAEQYINQAILEDPSNSYYQALLVLQMLMNGEVTQAEQQVQRIINIHPDDQDCKIRISEAYLTFSDTFFKDADNGGSYIDSLEDYKSILFWREKANELAQSERTKKLLHDWKEYGNAQFNKDNVKGLVTLFVFSILLGNLFIFGLIGVAVLGFCSVKPQWKVNKMAMTGERDIANTISRGLSIVGSMALTLFWEMLKLAGRIAIRL